MSQFLREHGRKGGLLTEIPRGMSWWLPRHLGGLGLPFLSEDGTIAIPQEEVSGRQKLLATMVMNSLIPGGRNLRAFPGAEAPLPPWAREGLLRDKRHEIAIPIAEYLLSQTPDEASDQTAEENCGKNVWGSGPYSSALWEQALCLPPVTDRLLSDPYVKIPRVSAEVASRVQLERVNRHWVRNWDRSRSASGIAPLEVLLSHLPVVHTFPAGLSQTFSKVRLIPRGMISRLSAIVLGTEVRNDGQMNCQGLNALVGDIPFVSQSLEP